MSTIPEHSGFHYHNICSGDLYTIFTHVMAAIRIENIMKF